MSAVRYCLGFLIICGFAFTLRAEEQPANFGDLSIEELMNIKVTSVSKKVEKLSNATSAIYVITNEDLRRSGVSTIADALRMAPGVNVAQADAHTWAISARGFQSGLSNKLLVLMDGRSVYSPLYSGVYWDTQDAMLEDLDRIEVVRGPGATVWGANAVNGVINVMSKSSADTQGWLASGSAGTKDTTIDSVRYGGKINDNAFYRFFVKYQKYDELSFANTGLAAHDGWDNLHAGTRFDFTPSKEDKIVLQGDYYHGMHEETQTLASLIAPFEQVHTQDATMAGGNALTRWTHTFSETSETSLQFYYDRTEREELKLDQAIDTLDVDFNHHLKLPRNEIVYGFGYRHVQEHLNQTLAATFRPPNRGTELFSGFLQDEIEVLKDKFSITLGTKVEHNDFTGFEVQPSFKALWNAAKDHTVWASVSRSVRTPAPTETDLRAYLLATAIGRLPVTAALEPNQNDLSSESEISYEVGYRAKLHPRFSFDTTAFFNNYKDLRSNDAGRFFVETNPPPLHLTLPVVQEPNVRGDTYGTELSANWDPLDRLKFSAGYSFLKIILHQDNKSHAPDAQAAENETPRNQFNIRAYVDLPKNVQFDTSVCFYDRLLALNVASYTRVDVRVGWRPTRNFDLSVGAQNLMRAEHVEFAPGTSKIGRNVYFKLTLRF